MKTVVDLVTALKEYFLGKDKDVEKIIASVEADATSSAATHAIGDQIIVDNVLYNVTAAIAIGDAITAGTNIQAADKVINQIEATQDQIEATQDQIQTLETNLTNLGNAAYQTSDSTETSINDADYIPFYDTSASAKKRILKSNLVPSVNSTLSSSSTSPVQNKVVSKALGTVETIGGTATKAYSKGDLMLASTGQLYSVIADIAQGGSITSGGNVEATDGIVSQINFSVTSMNLSRSTLPAGQSVSIGTLPAGGVYLVSVNLRLQSGTFENGVIISPCNGTVQNNHDYGQHFCVASGGSSIDVYNYSSSQLTLNVDSNGSNINYVKIK